MIKIFKINAAAEAMLYYWNRANGYSVEKRLDSVIHAYPSVREELSFCASPSIELQKRLDSAIHPDGELLKKYFRSLGNLDICAPFGFCLASLLLQFYLADRMDDSAPELFEYLKGLDRRKLMYGLCFGLIDKYDTVFWGDDSDSFFAKKVEHLPISVESKWSIMNAAFSIIDHLEELRSLIVPCADLIASMSFEEQPAIKAFYDLYSGCSIELLEKHFGHKLNTVDVMKVSPLVMAFDRTYAVIESDDGEAPSEFDPSPDEPITGRIFLGIAKHVIHSQPINVYSSLSDKLKILSDSTRLEILCYLSDHRVYGQELCDKFSLQKSALSYHITKLTAAGFITGEISGGKVYYSANKNEIEALLNQVHSKLLGE